MRIPWVVCCLCAAAIPSTPTAAQAPPPSRWMMQLVGPAVTTHADLRLEPAAARLLIESSDSAWLPLTAIDTTGNRLEFTAGGRRFVGTRDGDGHLAGTVTDSEGRLMSWRAQPVRPGVVIWPVRPRIAVRQLVVGSAATTTGFAERWLTATPSTGSLQAEHDRAVESLGWARAPASAVASRADDLALGFDPAARSAAQAVLSRIASGPAADLHFRRLFVGPDGTFRLDLHDVAWENARRRLPALRKDVTPLRQALVFIGALPQGSSPEPDALVRIGWQVWTQARRDPDGVETTLQRMAPSGGMALQALLSGYDEAEAWWRDAVGWLVNSAWVETPTGLTSPASMLAEFWGGDIGPLPTMIATAFGTPQAVPVLGARRLAPRLLRPRNAIAAEWLEGRTAAVDVLTSWREFDVGEPLEVTLEGGESAMVTAPATLMRTRFGSFLAADDAIRIEPGILPLFAVATVVHEWLHILVERSRLEGADAPGARETAWGLRLLEPDPWLGEGIAEWGAEVALAPARAMTPLLSVVESAKRIGMSYQAPDDPHVLGYALVRALRSRFDTPEELRDLLVRQLHDPAAVARAAGLDGPVKRAISRPATLAIVPEYEFTPDQGVADLVVRRLRLPVPLEAMP